MASVTNANAPKRVAIIGAGVTGLLIAQGLLKNGFQVTVYERDPSLEFRDNRPVSFMIHWGFETLSELLPADLWADIHTTFCNPAARDAKESEGIKFYNGHSGDLLFQAPPTVIKRVTRQKLRKHAAKGVDVRWSVTFDDLKVQDDGVKITFKDGSETRADFVIGADGPRSKVRQLLLGEEKSQLTKSDFVCGYTSAVLGQEKAEAILKAHPVWAMVYHSMGVLAIGAEDAVNPDDISTWIFNITRIWRGESPRQEGPDAIKTMKDITETFSEPFKSIVQGLPEDTPAFVRSLYYWRPVQWPNFDGKITIAGDAAHPMLPFRGQGLNNALDDAVKIVRALVEVSTGKAELKEAIDKYDADVVERGARAVDIAVNEGKLVQDMDRLTEMVVAKKGVGKP
ncbi:hypothetical protein V2G26_018851 [Clonostachys chloroleuca]